VKYLGQLSYGANNVVIALNEFEAAKIYEDDTRSDIGSEAQKMKFANAINTLVVKFIRLDTDEEKNCVMLVMERLYPIDFRSMEVEKREVIFSVFENEIRQLHHSGFIHRDLKRPSNISGETFDNIFLTDKRIRLIDVGISALRKQVGDVLFQKFIEKDNEDLLSFKSYFLSR